MYVLFNSLLEVLALLAVAMVVALCYRGLPEKPLAECPPREAKRLETIADVVKRVSQCVVSVSAQAHPDFDVLQRVFPGLGTPVMPRVAGTGVIIDPSGLILTAQHVVNGATTVRVGLTYGREWAANVVAADAARDTALLQISPGVTRPSLVGHVACLGDSSRLRVGEWVIGIGSPEAGRPAVSQGIISALDRHIAINQRTYSSLIQTDVALSAGYSGGPLLNIRGEVIGINAAIVPGGHGIGFAIPINVVKKVFSRLNASRVGPPHQITVSSLP